MSDNGAHWNLPPASAASLPLSLLGLCQLKIGADLRRPIVEWEAFPSEASQFPPPQLDIAHSFSVKLHQQRDRES